MEYFTKMAGISYDSLIGGVTVPQVTENVSIGSCEIRRGMLLSETAGVWNPATGSDYSKPLSIAQNDVESSENRVTTVYKSGQFNRSAIIVGSDINLDEYRESMRKDGIYLTDVKEGY